MSGSECFTHSVSACFPLQEWNFIAFRNSCHILEFAHFLFTFYILHSVYCGMKSRSTFVVLFLDNKQSILYSKFVAFLAYNIDTIFLLSFVTLLQKSAPKMIKEELLVTLMHRIKFNIYLGSESVSGFPQIPKYL